MILGRPANLILGALTALLNVIALTVAAAGVHVTPEYIAALNVAMAALVAVVAGQPPTVNPGDTVHVTNGEGSGSTVTRVVQTRDATRPVASLDRVDDPPTP
jgi:hypothetical protein